MSTCRVKRLSARGYRGDKPLVCYHRQQCHVGGGVGGGGLGTAEFTGSGRNDEVVIATERHCGACIFITVSVPLFPVFH